MIKNCLNVLDEIRKSLCPIRGTHSFNDSWSEDAIEKKIAIVELVDKLLIAKPLAFSFTEMKRHLWALAFLVLTVSCVKQIHPGSINEFDSKTYDSLTIYQSVLDEAKVQFLAGKLPQESKPIINKAGETYNLLRDAWLTYRAVQNPNNQALVIQLTAQMEALIADLNKILGKKEALCLALSY